MYEYNYRIIVTLIVTIVTIITLREEISFFNCVFLFEISKIVLFFKCIFKLITVLFRFVRPKPGLFKITFIQYMQLFISLRSLKKAHTKQSKTVMLKEKIIIP
jgi:hypothetical protein